MSEETKNDKVEEKIEAAEEAAVAATEEAQEAKEEVGEAKEAKEEIAEVKEPAFAEATADKEIAEAKEEAKPEEKPASAEATADKPEPSGKFKELIKQIEELSVLELSELVKELEDRFGVSAAAPVAMAAVGGAAAPGVAEAEEKTSYDVVLATCGDKKIQVIKAVREIKPDLGLKEAKDLVEGAPKDLLKGAKKEDAETAKAKLEEAGATVELK